MTRAHVRSLRAWLVIVALSTSAWSWIDRPAADVEQGNKAFAAGRFRDALAGYNRALRRGQERALHLNRGLALYQLAVATDGREREVLLSSAETALAYATNAERPRVRSLAFAALGTLYLRRDDIDEAVSACRRALIADPRNDVARNNLEIALGRRSERDSAKQQSSGTPGEPPPADPTEPPADEPPDSPDDGPGEEADETDAGGDVPAVPPKPAAENIGGDLDRKLDALERRSQVLRRKLFKRGEQPGGPQW